MTYADRVLFISRSQRPNLPSTNFGCKISIGLAKIANLHLGGCKEVAGINPLITCPKIGRDLGKCVSQERFNYNTQTTKLQEKFR